MEFVGFPAKLKEADGTTPAGVGTAGFPANYAPGPVSVPARVPGLMDSKLPPGFPPGPLLLGPQGERMLTGVGEPQKRPQVEGTRRGTDQKAPMKDHLLFNIRCQNPETMW